MFFRQVLNDGGSCASYVLGCKTNRQLAVIEPHAELLDEYLALAAAQDAPIVAVLETHLQADHPSGMAELAARTGATAYLPPGTGAELEHRELADGEVLRLGNTEIRAMATPGHALAHHAYLVSDLTRDPEPWLVLSGDALLFPSHYSGSLCGRGLSANPISTIGFERRHNRALQFDCEEEFAQALLRDMPPTPERHEAILAANRGGRG